MDDLVISTKGLTKYYGNRPVVYELDLEVPRGSIFGFLGRNGAGKSTTIQMLLGLVQPTRGVSTILGHDSRTLSPETIAEIGYLSESHFVYGWMTVEEARRFQSSFYKNWNNDIFWGVVDYFGLKAKDKAGKLSRGERAGLCLALTLAPEPALLILDDPALGLDTVARRSLIQSMLYVARQNDRTIFFSSHILSDVERVADRIGILDHGILRANCTIETFASRIISYRLLFDSTPPSLPEIKGLLEVTRTEQELTVIIANSGPETLLILNNLGAKSIEENHLNLEDAFISYTGNRGEKRLFLHKKEAV